MIQPVQSLVTVPEWHKSQALRLWDVLVLGPGIIYSATRVRGLTRAFLALAGVGIVIYNGRNWMLNQATPPVYHHPMPLPHHTLDFGY